YIAQTLVESRGNFPFWKIVFALADLFYLCERGTIKRDRFGVGESRSGTLPRAFEIRDRAVMRLRTLNMIAKRRAQIVEPIGEQFFKRVSDEFVQFPSSCDEH